MTKIKKLLPGGLLTTGMRIMMKTARSAGLKKTPKIAGEEFENLKKVRDVIQKGDVTIEGKKFDTSFLSEKDKVFKDMSVVLAKQKKARGFEKIAEAFSKSKDINPLVRKKIELTVPKLKEYSKQADEKIKALMLKDVFKPTLQKSGGFVDMTKDKKYWKGIL
jgi:phosphotransferase system IIA component